MAEEKQEQQAAEEPKQPKQKREKKKHKGEVEGFLSSLSGLAEIAAFVALGLTVALGDIESGETWRDGVVLVIRNASKYEVLASNKLDDGFDASPALADDAIYLRGYRNLYAIAAR